MPGFVCAEGQLNIANACIYARASYFRRAPRAEPARPRMHALAPTPLSLLPSPPPFPLPILPPLPFLSPSSYLPSPSLAIIVAVAAATRSLVAATAGSSLAAPSAGAFPCARLLRYGASASVAVVAVAVAVAALRRPAPFLELNSRDGALKPTPPLALSSPLPPDLASAPLFPPPLARSRTLSRLFLAVVVVVVAAAAATLLPFALFTGLNSGNGDLWVRLFPRRFCLPPCACKLRYCTTVIVIAAAVAAFL